MTMAVAEALGQDAVVEIRRQARIEWARRCAAAGDVLGWGAALFPHKFTVPFCDELHGYFVDIMLDEFTNTEAPRGHAKTTIKCFLIPLFIGLHSDPKVITMLRQSKHFNAAFWSKFIPHRHFLNVQATGPKAVAVNVAIRQELETNDWLRSLYGEQMSVRWTDQQFVLSGGAIFNAVSTGQSIRGINYLNIRPDYFIADDLYNEDDINNPDATIKKNEWFWGTLYPARSKNRHCSFHVQGTAINNEDLLEKLKKQDRWKSRTFKAVIDYDTKQVLWPELNTYESLMADKADMGSVIFYREMQNERREESTAIVKRSWIRYYKPEDIRFTLNFPCTAVLLGCDPSIGEKMENDYTAMALVLQGQYADGRGCVYYVEQLWNEHISLNQRVELLQRIADSRPKEFHISQARIEGISGFKDFAQEAVRRTNLPVKIIDRVKDKISTLENKSHFFENGKVFINENILPPLRDELVHQLTTNHPRHDDMRDALLLTLDEEPTLWNFVE